MGSFLKRIWYPLRFLHAKLKIGVCRRKAVIRQVSGVFWLFLARDWSRVKPVLRLMATFRTLKPCIILILTSAHP